VYLCLAMQVFRSLYNQYYTKPQILYMLIIPCKCVRKTIKGQLWEFRKSPCDYNERPFCAINLLMKWAKFIILHIILCKSFIHNKVNYTLKCPVIIMLHLYQYKLLQFSTPSPSPFCFNTLSNLHQFLICPLTFGLMPFGWLHSIMLNPYFWGKYHFLFMFTSSEMQLGHKTRARCNHNNAFVSVSTVSIQSLMWH
jgi:hypothetical protein